MKKRLKRILGAICIALLFCVVGSISVSAHRVYLDVVQQTVTVEAYYGDGKPAKNADITVYTADGEKYLNGTTDEDGRFSFDIGEGFISENLTVEVEQVGHRATVSISSGSSVGEKDESSLPFQIVAGLGYLFGLAGIASFYSAWKIKKTGKRK